MSTTNTRGRKKRFITAVEVETEMQNLRNEEGFVDKAESTIIKAMVKTAKLNCRIGDKTMMVVNPMYVHMPEWQRKTDMQRALHIGNAYNTHKWELPKILHMNGKLFCIDGQHRIYGAFKGGIENVTVEIMEMPMEEAIDLFLEQTEDRRKMSPADIYRASVVVGKEEYVLLREICKKHNVQIRDDEEVINPVGTLTSITDGISMIKGHPELFDNVLGLIGKLQWNAKTEGKAYGAKVLRVMRKLYAYYKDNPKAMEKALVTNCKGTEYFISNLMDKPQEIMFDYLSKVIEKNISASKIYDLRQAN